MVKKTLTRLFRIVLIPVLGGIIGLALLAVAFSLPTGRISAHVQASVPMLNQETDYFSITPLQEGARFDNYTEAIYLNEALINTKDESLINCILSGYQFNISGYSGTPVNTLSKVMEEPDNRVLSDSSKRFFNGYEVVIKPLLILTSYSGIRQINMYLSLFLTLCLFYLMLKRKLSRYILAVIVSLLFIRPLTVTLNMTFFGFYICTVVPCICILLTKKETLEKRAWLLFGITGAAVFYFNMNYIQLLSFGIPIMFYFFITGVPPKPLVLLKTIAGCFFAWLVGCVGMMVFKWIVYAVFVDADIFRQMINSILFRTDVDRGSRISAVVINSKTALGNKWWDLLEAAFVIVNIVCWLKSKKKFVLSHSELVLFIVMVLFPIGRYLILANHVIIHHWVTYRLLMMPVLAFNILITKMWSENGFQEPERIYI